MKYQLVLWDFDGTLADTLTLALQIYNRVAAEKHFLTITDPHAVRCMGMREFLKAHRIPAYYVPMLFSVVLAELKTHAADIALHPGVGDALRRISHLGIVQGIVSSNNTETIRCCLDNHGVSHLFQSITGTSRLFGKERQICRVYQKLNLSADRVLYVGDEIRDIQAADSAGLDIAAVTWGLNSAAALAACQPAYLAADPADLVKILNDGVLPL
ncbi:MAG: HAD-IA family hydrolase [Planctomycetaceae bacterium]